MRLVSDHVTDGAKQELETRHCHFNPFIPKQTIERKLRVMFQHVKVSSNVSQRVQCCSGNLPW